ncbi:MAG: acyltransferase [Bacteroidales bacterium]|nr:acyltransferase [Bacteroidales bacterium]
MATTKKENPPVKALYNWLNAHPSAKERVHRLIEHPRTRPRWWIRNLVMPFLIKKKKGAYISPKVRRDLYPYHPFVLGYKSIVEQNATLNNAMGPIIIGDHSRIGIGTVVLGETIIGNYVSTGQHCLLSGLNHNYEAIDIPIDLQGVYSDPITIEDDVLIGANSIICAGVTIGTHCFISAGSVVRHSIPPYSLVAGNPAKVIFNLKTGEKVN